MAPLSKINTVCTVVASAIHKSRTRTKFFRKFKILPSALIRKISTKKWQNVISRELLCQEKLLYFFKIVNGCNNSKRGA